MKAPERIYAGAAVAAGAVVLVVVLRFGGAIQPELPGLPTAGPVTVWGLPLVRFCYDVCALACVGTLTAAALAPAGTKESESCLRAAGWWALGWTFAALLSYVLTLSNLIPLPVADLLGAPDLLRFGTALPQTRALLWVPAVAALAAVSSRLRTLPAWVRPVIAAFGLLPPAYVGHAASAGDHDIAVSALMSHLVSVSVWVGGLAAVLVHFRRSEHLPAVLPRFSTLALCCFAAIAPLLLCLGAPLTLAASLREDLELPARRLTHPAVLFAAYPVAFLLLYATPWLPWSLSGYAPHLLTQALFVGLSLLIFWVLAGVDPLARPIPWAVRVRLLAAVTLTHLAWARSCCSGRRSRTTGSPWRPHPVSRTSWPTSAWPEPWPCFSRCLPSPPWPYAWPGSGRRRSPAYGRIRPYDSGEAAPG